MTKSKSASFSFNHGLHLFSPWYYQPKIFYFLYRLHIRTKGIQGSAKAMTQDRKPGDHGKVARYLVFPTRSLKRFGFYASLIFLKKTKTFLYTSTFFVSFLSGHALSIEEATKKIEARKGR